MSTWFLVYVVQVMLTETSAYHSSTYTQSASMSVVNGFESKEDCERAAKEISWDDLKTYCIEQKHHKKK